MIDPNELEVTPSTRVGIGPNRSCWRLGKKNGGLLNLPKDDELKLIFDAIDSAAAFDIVDADDFTLWFLVFEPISRRTLEAFKRAVADHPDTG